MDILQLKYFRAIAKFGNISQVAREFFVSQPGLSRNLTRLEEEVGVPLFERRRGRIILNIYGQIFLSKVNEALECLECGTDIVSRMYSREQNILSISCVIENFLSDYLKIFSSLHPEVGVRHFNCSIQEIENQLQRQNVDLAVCCHPLPNRSLVFEQLLSCNYVLVCSYENPLSKERIIDLADAKNNQFICEKLHLDRKELDSICQNCGFVPRINHEIDSLFIMLDLLEKNAGVVLIPLAYYKKISSLRPGHSFRALALNNELPPAVLGVAYLSEQHLSASAALFLEFLRHQTRNEQEEIDTYYSTKFQ